MVMDSSPVPSGRANPPVPKACQACALTKSKCVPQPGNFTSKCERCHRLNKDCRAQVPVPRKPRKPRTTRTAQLEEKLDGIVSLLTNTSRNAPTLPLDTTNIVSTADSSFKNSHDPRGGILTPPVEYASSPRVSRQPVVTPASLDRALPITDSSQDDQTLFDQFQTFMAPHFPFVVVEPNVTRGLLLSEKPLLYKLIIMVAACRSTSRQIILRKEIMNYIMEGLLIKNEKSLEFLQGLLLFIGWFHYHLPLPQLTNLTQLALALSYDLGLNKPAGSNAKYEDLVVESKCANERLMKREMRNLDEQRAFLGVFWLQSAIFPYLGKIQPMESTPHIEECCTILESIKQYSSDIHLVQLVRLQITVGKIRRNVPSICGIDAPIVMYMNSLQAELQLQRERLPADIMQNQLLILSIYGAECSIFEIGFQSAPAHLRTAENTYRQLETLHKCLASTKLFLETYISIPAALYWTLPISFFAQVAHVVSILSKLTLFDGDGWDVNYVRSYLDLLIVLQQILERFVEAGKGFDVDPVTLEPVDAFSRVARKIRRVSKWFTAKQASGFGQENIQLQDDSVQFLGSEAMAGVQSDCFLDDSFWREMMSDWDALQ